MFAEIRLEKIRELLKQTKSIEISALVKLFSVSEATIRRDLEKLEQENYLYRIHGGAVMIENNEQPIEAPIENADKKNKIGYLAAQLIEDQEIIFIGQGTTCEMISKHIKEKNGVTVITNNIEVINELKGYPNLNVIGTGGNVKKSNAASFFTGDMSIDMLQSIYVKKAFLGIGGLQKDTGIFVNSMEETRIWKSIFDIAEEVLVVCDSTKIDQKGLTKVANLNKISKLITDHEISDAYLEMFYDIGIPVYTSYDLNKHKSAD